MTDLAVMVAEALERRPKITLPSLEAPLGCQVQKLLDAINGDELLAEACLVWLQSKKQHIEMSKLVALMGQEWVTQKLQEVDND